MIEPFIYKYVINDCFFGCYDISTFVGYLTPNTFFYGNSLFYFKQINLAYVNSLIVKNISI